MMPSGNLPVRTAAFDIGSNSILLLVADVRPDGSILPITDEIRITRLGRGVDSSGGLSPEAIQRSLAAVEELAALCRDVPPSRIAAAGTSALRDASNASDFLIPASRILGTDVRVISGDDEARLSFESVISDPAMTLRRPVMIADVGGGSTELVSESGEGLDACSVDVGAVRLTERFLASDPPAGSEVEAASRASAEALAGVLSDRSVSQMMAVGGTIVNLGCIAGGGCEYSRVHARKLTLEDVSGLVRRLASVPLDERRRIPGLEPARADVIVGGAIIYETLLKALMLPEVTISTRGLRYGVALRAAAGTWA